jgi:hypothetical protein
MEVGLRTQLYINLFLCASAKVEVHLHSVLCTEPEPIIGDFCYTYVGFSSVQSLAQVASVHLTCC